jgi:immunoglobulin-binding protein 1
MAESSSSLRSFFLLAKAKETELSSTGSSSSTYQDNIQSAISMFEECRKLIERLAIFSPNETIEDISTSAIQ